MENCHLYSPEVVLFFALLDNKQSGGLYSYGLMSQWMRSDEAENEESHHAERENIWL